MKTALLGVMVLAVLILAAPAVAHEGEHVTLDGKMMCGKCVLALEGLEQCQDVVVTKGEGDERMVYYVVKNDVFEAAGHECRGKRSVRVTGSLAEEDGVTWITAETIEVEEES